MTILTHNINFAIPSSILYYFIALLQSFITNICINFTWGNSKILYLTVSPDKTMLLTKHSRHSGWAQNSLSRFQIRSESEWRWYINTAVFLDITGHPALFKTHYVSETGFHLSLQVEPTQFGPTDRSLSYASCSAS
jgi:hypothetical protein